MQKVGPGLNLWVVETEIDIGQNTCGMQWITHNY
jgi:hypothetical protein